MASSDIIVLLIVDYHAAIGGRQDPRAPPLVYARGSCLRSMSEPSYLCFLITKLTSLRRGRPTGVGTPT